MARFFVFGSNVPRGGTIVLSGADAEHAKVLRLRVGDRIVVSDGAGTDRFCTIRGFSPEGVSAEVDEAVPNGAEPSVAVTVLAGLPKQGERSDYTVQKCTECGAARIVFFVSHRCAVVKPTAAGLDRKVSRWQRIAGEAAKQSGRGTIPEVSAVGDFAGALDIAVKTGLPLMLYETGERTPLKETLRRADMETLKSAALITGPEGGFEPFEAELARRLDIPLCSMGPRILRCETAPVAALTALMYETGNL